MSALPGQLVGSKKQALQRAEGQCEVMVRVGEACHRRCPGWGDHVRYLLPPERGGKHLDKAWESHHLIVLCKIHARAFDEADPALADLVIAGEVAWVAHRYQRSRHSHGRPAYTGPDAYLAERYPPLAG